MRKILTFILLLTVVFLWATPQETYAYPEPKGLTSETEFRATWLSHFIGSLPAYTNEASFKQQASAMLDHLEHNNINAMIIHFRTHNNALYKSDLNPIASWFSQVNFNAFDPMEWLIEAAHARGIEFHAWLNPYRVLTTYQSGALPPGNPQNDPNNLLTYSGATILNPALPNVRQHVVDSILEILERYDVDAIHFDDYFYMNLGANGGNILTEPDQDYFLQNNLGFPNTKAGKSDWRREQVNFLIEDISDAIKTFNQDNDRFVQFGISPTGIYRNGDGVVTYDGEGMPITSGSLTQGQEHYASYLFADSLKWIKEGWLDYILPQSYWASTHPIAGYPEVMGWWDKVVRYLDVNLYSGIGVYMADANPASEVYSWRNNPNEFKNQLAFLETLDNVSGFSIYSYNMVRSEYQGAAIASATQIKNARSAYWQNIAILPEIKSMTPVHLPSVTNVLHNAGTGKLTFDAQAGAKFYYIYRSDAPLTYENDEIVAVIPNTGGPTIEWNANDFNASHHYGVRSLSGTNHLSPAFVSDVLAPTYQFSGTFDGLKFTSPAVLTLISADDIVYSMDGVIWENYTEPINVNWNGNHTIYYKAIDQDSNESNINMVHFEVAIFNSDVPQIVLTGDQEGANYLTGVSATIASDEHEVWYKINLDGAWTKYTTPLIFSNAASYRIEAKTKDINGIESTSVTRVFKVVEKTYPDPAIQIQGTGEAPYYQSVDVTITSSAPVVSYKINQGAYQTYTGPFTIDIDGEYTISARNEDGTKKVITTSFTIGEAPQTSYPAPTITVTGDGEDPYFQAVEIVIDGTAPSISYRINNGAFQPYTEPIPLTVEGTYVIEARNEDVDKIIVTKTIHIDVTPPPVPQIVIDGTKEGNNYVSETEITLFTTEEHVTIMYRLHNGRVWSSWQLYTDPLELSISANYTIEFYAIDRALNESDRVDELIRLVVPPSETNQYVIRNGDTVKYYQTNTPVELPTTYIEKDAEIRAVWVATVVNIDIGLHENEVAYKAEIISILDRMVELNFNVMFFQTRPMNDAFYDSEYAPWSRFLTGNEGEDPGWDVLQFILDEAHARNIEVHAWLNPYRVSQGTEDKATQLDALDNKNFAKQNPNLLVQDRNGALILNPGEPEVRNYIYDVVEELMEKYNVDGVHFDDYFYSYAGTDDTEDNDAYYRTKLTGESKADWRRRNVDILVQTLHQKIQNYNINESKTVKFGISPFGIWDNKSSNPLGSNTQGLSSYSAQYADSRKWVKEGWLDYIMPQLYWEFNHSVARFADLVDWWVETVQGTGVDLIIGQGFYRYADNSWTDPSEITEQLRYMSQYDEIIGSSFFSHKVLNNPHANVVQALDRIGRYYWTGPVDFPWETGIHSEDKPNAPTYQISEEANANHEYTGQITLSFQSENEDDTIYYRLNQGSWLPYEGNIVINTPGTYQIGFKTVSAGGLESLSQTLSVTIIERVEETSTTTIVLVVGGISLGTMIGYILIRKFVLKV
ncbi:MAG: family 10 glycosylhydrolase [Acholeplasmataceae bacterium]